MGFLRFHLLISFQIKPNFKTGYIRQCTLTKFHDVSLAIIFLPTLLLAGFLYIAKRKNAAHQQQQGSQEKMHAYHRYALLCKLLYGTSVSVITNNFSPFTLRGKRGEVRMSYDFRFPATVNSEKYLKEPIHKVSILQQKWIHFLQNPPFWGEFGRSMHVCLHVAEKDQITKLMLQHIKQWTKTPPPLSSQQKNIPTQEKETVQ